MAKHYYTVSWDQLHRDARALSWRLVGKGPVEGNWRGIVGVTRGGLIPAAIVARELGCRLVESVSVASYDHDVQRDPVVLKQPPAAGDGEGFLVIDDLADTGRTLRAVREILPRAFYACLYAKPAGHPFVDLFVTEVSQDTWILFPWDTAPQFVAPLGGGAG